MSASEMTYIVSGGALNSTHSLTHSAKMIVEIYAQIAPFGMCASVLLSVFSAVLANKRVHYVQH